MLTSPITLTYDATPVTMKRINQDNYSSLHYGKNGDDRLSLTVKHTIPKTKGGSGESHLVRLDIEKYDTSGVLLRTIGVWAVMKTSDGTQDDDESVLAQDCLAAFLGSGTVVADILARES